MLRGSLLWKVKARGGSRERLFRLQEDGVTVCFEGRFGHARSPQSCECPIGAWGHWCTSCTAMNCREDQDLGSTPNPPLDPHQGPRPLPRSPPGIWIPIQDLVHNPGPGLPHRIQTPCETQTPIQEPYLGLRPYHRT